MEGNKPKRESACSFCLSFCAMHGHAACSNIPHECQSLCILKDKATSCPFALFVAYTFNSLIRPHHASSVDKILVTLALCVFIFTMFHRHRRVSLWKFIFYTIFHSFLSWIWVADFLWHESFWLYMSLYTTGLMCLED